MFPKNRKKFHGEQITKLRQNAPTHRSQYFHDIGLCSLWYQQKKTSDIVWTNLWKEKAAELKAVEEAWKLTLEEAEQ